MLHWIDTHAHLQDEAFASDYDVVIARAQAVGVNKIVLPACNEKDQHRVLELAAEYPATCYAALGLHPGEVSEDFEQQLVEIQLTLEKQGAVEIGRAHV